MYDKIPPRLPTTLIEYAPIPSAAFSMYQPTSCPIDTNASAVNAKSGTVAPTAAKILGMDDQVSGRVGTPHTSTPDRAPTSDGISAIMIRSAGHGSLTNAARARSDASVAKRLMRRRER